MIGSSDVAFLSSVLDDIDVLTRKVNMSNNMLEGVVGCVQLMDAIDYSGPNVHGGILIYNEAVRIDVVRRSTRIKNMKYRVSEETWLSLCTYQEDCRRKNLIYYSIGSRNINIRTELSLVRRAYEDRQYESGYRLNEWEENARAFGVALLRRNTDASISSVMNEAGTLDSRGGIAVSGSNQMASNVSHQARQGSREEALISSCSRCTSVHVEQETANDGHIPREVSVVKKRIPNCEEEFQTLKKSKEVHLEDVVDLTHVQELEPLDFKDEEAKLARNLESLKRRYPKPGFIMYRYFLISIALVEKSVVGTEYGVYDENYNNDGEKDE